MNNNNPKLKSYSGEEEDEEELVSQILLAMGYTLVSKASQSSFSSKNSRRFTQT